jgi:hypothetical protein
MSGPVRVLPKSGVLVQPGRLTAAAGWPGRMEEPFRLHPILRHLSKGSGDLLVAGGVGMYAVGG